MRFSPKSEAEISEGNLLPAGTYPFQVLEATDKQSKAGNDMIALKLGIEDSNGSQRAVFDYLLEAMEYKLRHFAEAVGLLKAYEKGELHAEMLVGLSGECRIAIKAASGGYDPKNEVKDYIKGGVDVVEPAKKSKKDEQDDMDSEIPF